MSFRIPPAAPARPNRCQMFVPGTRPDLFAKAAASAADVVNLDLEDSVAPADKAAARANVLRGVREIDWGRKTLSVRINGLDTEYWYRDVVDLVEAGGERLDLLMIPKAGTAGDVYAVDALVSSIELATRRRKRLGLEVIIETAQGLQHVGEIAASSPRLQAMSLGAADFAASMGMATTGIGGTQEGYYVHRQGQDYWGDPWHHATVAIVAACRTHGLLPVDGPFGDFSDEAGFRAQARRVLTLGMVGKWAIHPGQVALCNEIFTPSEAQIADARAILAAMAEAEAKGLGAVSYKGRMIDVASIRQAQVMVQRAELMAG